MPHTRLIPRHIVLIDVHDGNFDMDLPVYGYSVRSVQAFCQGTILRTGGIEVFESPSPLLTFMYNQPTASPSTPSTSTSPHPPSPSLIALPSMSHSLSSLPTMTSLPNMLYYGTLGAGATRNLSEAKLDSALRRPRKFDAQKGTHLPNQDCKTHPCWHSSEDDRESQIIFYPKRNNNGTTNSKAK